ncbi:MAG: hypothetical protein CM1200mP14_06900 [Gammaproteobacteria bacterium]|nr:MAG: hypothetical protein CM1200mP14_06900 [Gammaproteobacteria bacterium]
MFRSALKSWARGHRQPEVLIDMGVLDLAQYLRARARPPAGVPSRMGAQILVPA